MSSSSKAWCRVIVAITCFRMPCSPLLGPAASPAGAWVLLGPSCSEPDRTGSALITCALSTCESSAISELVSPHPHQYWGSAAITLSVGVHSQRPAHVIGRGNVLTWYQSSSPFSTKATSCFATSRGGASQCEAA